MASLPIGPAQAVLAGVLLVLGLASALPVVHDAVWRVSVGASVYGHLLVPLALLALPWGAPTATRAIAVVAAALLLVPTVRSLIFARDLPERLDDAFGRGAPLSLQGPPLPLETVPFGDGLTLDLLRPEGDGPFPVVVVVHGGSWQRGDSTQLPDLNRRLASRGVAVAAVNYRKAPAHPFPAARDDVLAAIARLDQGADEWALDTSRLVLLGRSAGGQLALSAAPLAAPRARGVVVLYAPVDLRWSWRNPSKLPGFHSRDTLRAYLGGSLDEHPERYRAASPLADLADPPPMLLVHGTADRLVSPVHARRLDARLSELDVPHLLLEIPGGKHGLDANLIGPWGLPVMRAVERFVGTVTESR